MYSYTRPVLVGRSSQTTVGVTPSVIPGISQAPNTVDGIDAGSAWALGGTLLWFAIMARKRK
jgi:hypothetical protein